MANESRWSKSWLINEASGQDITLHKAEQDRWEQTVTAMESVAQGQVVSGESVHMWLRSWGTEDELAPPKCQLR